MKAINRLYFLTLVLVAAVACGVIYSKPTETSQTDFSITFFKTANSLSPEGENVVVSPYSAAVALSMLAEGAQGQTREEFDKVLGNVLYKAADLGNNDSVVVKSANSLWLNNDFSPRNRYVSLLSNDFDAFLDVENFADPAAVRAINNWCSEHTEGKISQIISKLNPREVLVLLNALYFNAPWENEFDASKTSRQTFFGLSGESSVEMMDNQGYYLYAEQQGYQIIQLPYKGLRYAMYVVLPPKGTDIDQMFKTLDKKTIDSTLDSMQQRKVKLLLPKFKIETSMSLIKVLQKMGIKTAFTPAADFGGIVESGQIAVSEVKQKCFIDVSEKGTEAAAVTSVQIVLTSVRPMCPVMRVDRPFAFIIADGENENMLFAGKIVNM